MKRPELLAQYETQQLKNKLLEFPELIKKQKAILRDLRENLKNASQTMAILEADLATEIAAEIDPNTGKYKFSNDKARQAELVRRKMQDPKCQEAAMDAEAELQKILKGGTRSD